MDKKLARYKELQELSSVSLVDTMDMLKKMIQTQKGIKSNPTKMVVTRSMFETAQRILLKNNHINPHEIEVNFNE